MREASTKGVICVKDTDTLIEYALCTLELVEREDDTFKYVFRPNYAVIDLVGPPLFQGIPGLNLDLRRKEYVRENKTPVFVSERAPAENREDVWILLEREGMGRLNKLEWLIRTNTCYSGDGLYVRRFTAEDELGKTWLGDLSDVGVRSSQAIKLLLEEVCSGRDVEGEGFSIRDDQRASAHALLRQLYLKEKSFLDSQRSLGVRKAAGTGRYRGRKPKPVDEIRMRHVFELYKAGEVGSEKAASMLGISRATFFRRLKAFDSVG